MPTQINFFSFWLYFFSSIASTLILPVLASPNPSAAPIPDHDIIPPHASATSEWQTSRKAESFWAIIAIFGVIAILGYAMWRAGICNINEAALEQNSSSSNGRGAAQTFTIGSLLKSMGNSGPGGASNTHYSRLANDEDDI